VLPTWHHLSFNIWDTAKPNLAILAAAVSVTYRKAHDGKHHRLISENSMYGTTMQKVDVTTDIEAQQLLIYLMHLIYTACIGFVHRSEFHISSPSWFSGVLMDLGRSTWLMPYSLSPELQVDHACGHRQPQLATVGDRAFPVAVAWTWNSLPAEVTSSNSLQTFKTKLKSQTSRPPFLSLLRLHVA